MSLIQISHLSFRYDGGTEELFQDVSLNLDSGWHLGLLGRNGRGKTTFLHLLEGRYAYRGTIKASVDFSYFPYQVENPQKSAGEVVRAVVPEHETWQLEKELRQLKVNLETLERPFHTLSKGEQTKVLLAALFLRDHSFLLIDEPTNHLDLTGRNLVQSYLRTKSGYILVSHDRAFLDGCVDHILAINRANLELQSGTCTTWLQNKALQDRFELEQNEKLGGEIKRLKRAAGRAANWSDQVEKSKNGTRKSGLRPDKGYIGHQAAKMMKRSKNIELRREKAIEEKGKLLNNLEQVDPIRIQPLSYHRQSLLTLRQVSIAHNGVYSFEPIDLTLSQGERIALVGENGVGKSSLLKRLMGEPLCSSGTIQMGSGLVLSYVAQDTAALTGTLRTYCQTRQIDLTQLLTMLRKFGFSREQLEVPIAAMSHGQKKKILLAASLCERAHLYLWDEPLNYLDLDARMQLEQMLKACEPTMVFVEHDAAFCAAVATREVRLKACGHHQKEIKKI